ncbi:biopolymer transporter ExbD [Pseudophaeobacter sp. EL27]|uniref:ExbD/TolR family protein n=1 Tax=Pseudophaeobacter sp. EL27 TaxID=2107580 RepID=UPI000EFC87F1|nr:biopolymer transporter ExbD [Pseudophaeobacter sp. EL27]
MQLKALAQAQKEPTIALINIVFLMLIFFMIAGTLAPPIDKDLSLVKTTDLEGREPPDTLVVHADGRLSLRGEPVPDAVSYVLGLPAEAREVVKIVPDQALPAKELVRLGNALRAAGAQRVVLISERAL